MRHTPKMAEPEILAANAAQWLAEYRADKANATKRYRYRHPEIKERLKEESGSKCIYCESKIGHNCPGEIEHKVPTSKNENLHFTWSNLAIACGECNRRKNDYFSTADPFLDPHVDPVDLWLEHHGPLVAAVAGNERAEISVRVLELSNGKRLELVMRKMEAISRFVDLHERCHAAKSPLKELLREEMRNLVERDREFSGMLVEVARRRGLT